MPLFSVFIKSIDNLIQSNIERLLYFCYSALMYVNENQRLLE